MWKPSRHKTTRIKSVYFYIKENGPIGNKALEQEFEVSERTIQRDVLALHINGLIEKDGQKWMVTQKKVKQSREGNENGMG